MEHDSCWFVFCFAVNPDWLKHTMIFRWPRPLRNWWRVAVHKHSCAAVAQLTVIKIINKQSQIGAQINKQQIRGNLLKCCHGMNHGCLFRQRENRFENHKLNLILLPLILNFIGNYSLILLLGIKLKLLALIIMHKKNPAVNKSSKPLLHKLNNILLLMSFCYYYFQWH